MGSIFLYSFFFFLKGTGRVSGKGITSICLGVLGSFHLNPLFGHKVRDNKRIYTVKRDWTSLYL